MSAQRRAPSRRRAFIFATALAVVIGASVQARAQVDDNIQSRLAPYTPPLIDKGETVIGQIAYDVCLTSGDLVYFLAHSVHKNPLALRRELYDMTKEKLKEYFSDRAHRAELADLVNSYFLTHREIANVPWRDLLRHYWEVSDKEIDPKVAAAIKVIPILALNFCASTSTVKVTFPFNPTYETNVLKSNLGDSRGESTGFGGMLQLVTPGLRPLDLIGLSLQSQSIRYSNPFSSKNVDSITATAAYQFFISAYGTNPAGQPYAVFFGMDKKELPPPSMITVDTVAIGVQNQTVYMPLFRVEQVNLFTPQVTFTHQNMPLFVIEQCATRIPDPSKFGYCYYADISVTVGQTFSDVATQENTNVALALTPGWRIRDTDWKLTLPATVTARGYQNVPGGRQDLQLQIGPTLTYAPAPFFIDPAFITSVLFTLSTTYNQNYSTVAKNSWHGIIVMPTLTVAFAP